MCSISCPGDQGIKAAIFFPCSQPDPPPRSIFVEGTDMGWSIYGLPRWDRGRPGTKVTSVRPRSRTERSGQALISCSSKCFKELPSHGNAVSGTPFRHRPLLTPWPELGRPGAMPVVFSPGDNGIGEEEEEEEGGEPRALPSAAPAACSTLPAPGPAGSPPWRSIPVSRGHPKSSGLASPPAPPKKPHKSTGEAAPAGVHPPGRVKHPCE